MSEEAVSSPLEAIKTAREKIFSQIHRVVVGQDEAIEHIIIAILAGGHALLLGVPGLGKTLLVKSVARMFSLDFKRIQFTPDLMPADIFGSELIEEDPATGKRSFRFSPGPLFANIILADEINRTPPKTQAALLEAMGEQHVTVGGETRPLPPPFFVLATQNPVELEGTYALPEAQLDRFLLNIVLDYLTVEDEMAMVSATTGETVPELETIFTGAEIMALQAIARQVPAADNVVANAVRLVSATRPTSSLAPALVKEKVKWGAGSRASQALIMAGKARALLHGRHHVSTDDVRALAVPVLRHRVIPNFHADAAGITSTAIIEALLQSPHVITQ
ncbi:MAG: MoxR family ATPase [Lentisphaeria bacterium]|nr:MoxR family ATPase [Lentisphaeria bacterium]